MISTQINFRSIRPHSRGQESAFEELTRQLILADPPPNTGIIENRGYGADGGVEILTFFSDGTCWGWQSKYFIDGIGDNQISQLKKSFETALRTYPTLTKYIVAVPRDLSGPGNTPKNTERRKWDAFVESSLQSASKKMRKVEIELWDESGFIRRLTRHDPYHAGMRAYWFDQSVFTTDEFKLLLDPAIADLGERYSPEDHVDVEAQNFFDLLSRNVRYQEFCQNILSEVTAAAQAIAVLHSPKEAADDIPNAIRDTNDRLQTILQALKDIDWLNDSEIDLVQIYCELASTWRSDIFDILRNEYFSLREEKDLNPDRSAFRDQLSNVLSKLRTAMDGLKREDVNLLKNPTLVIDGDAGSGKSHILAHNIHQHVLSGGPGLLLLGQHLKGPDPRSSILSRLGFADAQFSEVLGALQAAALATGRPAILAIDAINESVHPEFWKSCIAGLQTEFSRFNRVALIVSCRSTYAEYCLPETLEAVRLCHRGFAENSLAAAKQYLDNHGILRPATPFLNPEFSNPLFLSTVVKALKKKGQKSFPVGLDGITSLFDFWLESVEENLIRKGFKRIAPRDGRIQKALQKFAEQLAIEGLEALDRDAAVAILEEEVKDVPCQSAQDLLMERLIDEGIIRREPNWNTDGEQVSFTFQRFSDHFIARTIIQIFDDRESLARALGPNGDYAHFGDGNQRGISPGIIEALFIQVPEKLGCELPDITPGFSSKAHLPLRAFLESLLWRTPSAITGRTVELLEIQLQREAITLSDYYTLLLKTACIAETQLDANYLHGHLVDRSMTDRDRNWSTYLHHIDYEGHPVEVLIDWAWSNEAVGASVAQVELAAMVLTWFTTTSNRSVRDRATKALAALVYQQPELASFLLDRFAHIDDDYLIERLLASCLGGLIHTTDVKLNADAAIAAYNLVFNTEPLTRNAFIRRYARSVVEHALHLAGVVPGIEPLNIRPPYRTDPIQNWPTVSEIAPFEAMAPHAFSSVIGWLSDGIQTSDMAGDFGRYTLGGVDSSFSRQCRSDGKPNTPEQTKRKFWNDIRGDYPELHGLIEDLHLQREARDKIEWAVSLPQVEDETYSIEISQPKELVREAEARFVELEQEFLSRLTPDQYSQYKSKNWYLDPGDNRVEKFSLAVAQRWIISRVVELGAFSVENPEPETQRENWSRRDHRIERISKKYQWIAFFELIGHLMDHHWYIDWRDDIQELSAPDVFRQTDIDPSYIPREAELLSDHIDLPKINLPKYQFSEVLLQAALQWLQTTDDIPHAPDLITHRTSDGAEWITLSAYWRAPDYMEKLQSSEVFRTGQGWIDVCLVKRGDAKRLHELMKDKDIVGDRIIYEGEGPTILFGELRAGYEGDSRESILNNEYKGIETGSVVRGYQAIREEYDSSVASDERHTFHIPSKSFIEAGRLRPVSLWSRIFVNMNDQPVFTDMLLAGWKNNLVIAREDVLNCVAEQNDLELVWIYKGERDAGLGRGQTHSWNPNTDRRGFGGIWWRIGDVWHGSTWLSPSSWNERR